MDSSFTPDALRIRTVPGAPRRYSGVSQGS